MESSLMHVNDAARLLYISKWTIYRWIEEGRLHATKIGHGSLRVFRESVTALVEANRMEQPCVTRSSPFRVVRVSAASVRKSSGRQRMIGLRNDTSGLPKTYGVRGMMSPIPRTRYQGGTVDSPPTPALRGRTSLREVDVDRHQEYPGLNPSGGRTRHGQSV